MIWASKEDEKVEASPEMVAICPTCQGEVISKCGTILNRETFGKGIELLGNYGWVMIKWHSPPKNWLRNTKDIYIDMNNNQIIRIKKLDKDSIYAKLLTKDEFFKEVEVKR